jgi:mRNA-degrading endonuclease toxin of MazEF toxin-antitoxin module
VLQTPETGSRQRIVCPVSTTSERGITMHRLVILDQDCVVLLPLMLFIPLVALGEAVGSATSIRSDIVNGIDRIFFGI